MKKLILLILGFLILPTTIYASVGDIYYGSTTYPFTTALPIGNNGYVLTSNGSKPIWQVSTGGGGGCAASAPFGSVQYAALVGTSTCFGSTSNFTYASSTNILSVLNSSTTNATTTNFYTNVIGLGASAISYIQSLFSATTPIVDTTGVISCPTCVTNQYASSTFPTFTYASSTYYLASNPNGYTSNAGTVTSITATSPLTGGTISTSGSIGCQTASGSQAGCLASADWTTFNNKLSNLLGGLNAILGNSTTTNATTTSLAITGLSNTILAVNTNGTVIATTTSSGTNYFSNSGATTTLTTGSVLQATTASTSILCLGGTCQSSFSGGSQTPWTSNINGGGYNLTNVGIASSTYFSAHSQGSNVTPSYYFDSDSTTGLGGSTGNVWIDIAGVKKAQWSSTQFLTVNDIIGGSQTANTIDIQNTASSASTPTYSFYGAGNNSTGMYSSGTGNLNFSVSGTEKARFTTTGLGIGTTTPATALSVIGTTTADCFALNSSPTSCISGSGGSGTVTSVALTVPTGLSVSGSPITTSGTLGLTLTAGYTIPLTASTTQWASAYASTSALSGTSPVVYNASTGAISCPTCATGSSTNFFANSSATTSLTTGTILNAPTGTFGTLNATSSFNSLGTSTLATTTVSGSLSVGSTTAPQALSVTVAGNVGVGTTTASTALSVVGTTTLQGLVLSTFSGSTQCLQVSTTSIVSPSGSPCGSGSGGGGGTPGGSNQQVQVNNNGAFAGASTLAINGSTGYLNIGATTTPSALVTINASTTLASTTNAFVIASSSNNVVAIDANGDQTNGLSTASTTFNIDPLGHPMYGGPVPTCTTGCTMTGGSDALMRVITGSSISSVTITFANKWVNATGVGISPSCVADDESGVTTGVEASTTPTTVVLSLPTALTSENISVFCAGSYSYTQ